MSRERDLVSKTKSIISKRSPFSMRIGADGGFLTTDRPLWYIRVSGAYQRVAGLSLGAVWLSQIMAI